LTDEVNSNREKSIEREVCMGRKLRIAILFNEPVTLTREERQYVSETGLLKETRTPLKQGKGAEKKQPETPPLVDLSEVGGMEEMDDIKAASDTNPRRSTWTAIFFVSLNICGTSARTSFSTSWNPWKTIRFRK
jgi:hypothetical protein